MSKYVQAIGAINHVLNPH